MECFDLLEISTPNGDHASHRELTEMLIRSPSWTLGVAPLWNTHTSLSAPHFHLPGEQWTKISRPG